MAAEESLEFGQHLESATERYLDGLSECVGALPAVIDAYRADTEYRSITSKIQRLESDCDRTKLELGRLITSSNGAELGLRVAWVHRHADRMIELYGQLDTIANVTEQFAEELIAIAPSRRIDCLDGLKEMAELAVVAMEHLARVVMEFVRTLCRPDYDASVTDGVSTIRALEGDCDSVRNQVLETAFNGEDDRDALAYRQLAVLLDGVLDRIEDVTDRMHLMTGLEGWLDIEIYPEIDY